MKKREYQRVLCELFVQLLMKGPTAPDTVGLEELLLTRAPGREEAFTAWAVEVHGVVKPS